MKKHWLWYVGTSMFGIPFVVAFGSLFWHAMHQDLLAVAAFAASFLWIYVTFLLMKRGDKLSHDPVKKQPSWMERHAP